MSIATVVLLALPADPRAINARWCGGQDIRTDAEALYPDGSVYGHISVSAYCSTGGRGGSSRWYRATVVAQWDPVTGTLMATYPDDGVVPPYTPTVTLSATQTAHNYRASGSGIYQVWRSDVTSYAADCGSCH